MTTTDMAEPAPTPPTPPDTAPRTLRRVRSGRIGAGVGGGLGAYFGVDPVIFRVLFATSAFFGGAGILAYLLAWAAIPEEGTERAPIDGWIGELRRRRIPPWVAAVAAGLFLWAVSFSWWAPGPLIPIVAVVVLLVVAFGRRDLQGTPAAAPDTTVDLTKTPPRDGEPAWVGEVRGWWAEAQEAARVRARRALPVKIVALTALGLTLGVLAIVDAVDRVAVPVYFWTSLGIILGGLVVGVVLRRTPWSISSLLLPAVLGVVAFAGSNASFADGIGDRTWVPTGAPGGQYRLAFGQGTLDLRSLPTATTPTTVRVDAAAGRLRVIVPRTANVRVEADVRFGDVEVDGDSRDSGAGVRQVVAAPAGATGAPVTVLVHLADGQVQVERR